MRLTWTASCVLLLTVGCSTSNVPAPSVPRKHQTVESHTSHDEHQHRTAEQKTWLLMLETEPVTPEIGVMTTLKGHIQADDGTRVTAFDVLHEKLVHLIVVREGLDEFAHLHPDVTSSGGMSIPHGFPKAGNYWLFADFQPKGQSPALATGQVSVAGDTSPAKKLVANESNEVMVDSIKAQVKVEAAKVETVVSFQLLDANGSAVTDLQPYLGAMGHLVIISADGREYVHAHPMSDATTAPDGVVKFAAHLTQPGLYKAWGQFQRNNEVFTVPYVLKYAADSASTQHKEH